MKQLSVQRVQRSGRDSEIESRIVNYLKPKYILV